MLLEVLKKLGINYENLEEWEKQSFDEYEKRLATKEIKLDDVKDFVSFQISTLQSQLLSYDNSKDKDLFLKACLRNMMILSAFIGSSENQKKQALEELKQRFNL